MRLVAPSSSRLLFALPMALAMVTVAASGSFGVTIYTWNGAVDSDFTNAGNWSGASVAPTNTTGDYRITVNNGSGSKLVYTAAQGHTIYTSGDRALFIGTGASGAMTITGGIFESQATSQDGLCNTTGTATLTIDGGEYRNTAGSGAQTFLVTFGSGGTGNLVIESGAFSVTTLRYQGGSTTGNVYLNGGTLSVGQITDSGGISDFFFDGGALVALKTTTSFLSGLDNAQILAGGAVIDTGTFDVTIGQSLSDGGGGGGLTKLGTGTLTLSGNNTYTGTTSVEAGTLTVSGETRSAIPVPSRWPTWPG